MAVDDEDLYPVRAPGWAAIDGALSIAHPGQTPHQFTSKTAYDLGGTSPLPAISVYAGDRPAHWHYVTYGLTELFEKSSPREDVSGFGFELTFKLPRAPDEAQPPVWPLQLLQGIGGYLPRRRHRRRRHRHVGRLPPRRTGLDRRGAARARPAHLGHHLARGRADGHVRLDVGDLDRDAQVHARPLLAARGRDRAGDRLQAGRVHRARRRRDRLEEYRRVAAFNRYCGVDVHEISPREVAELFPLARTDDMLAGFYVEGRRPREPGRRDDGAGQGRAPCVGVTIAEGVPVTGVITRGRGHGRRPTTAHRVRVRRQLRRHVGPPARRARPA
jgi:hypothetical protein